MHVCSEPAVLIEAVFEFRLAPARGDRPVISISGEYDIEQTCYRVGGWCPSALQSEAHLATGQYWTGWTCVAMCSGVTG